MKRKSPPGFDALPKSIKGNVLVDRATVEDAKRWRWFVLHTEDMKTRQWSKTYWTCEIEFPTGQNTHGVCERSATNRATAIEATIDAAMKECKR